MTITLLNAAALLSLLSSPAEDFTWPQWDGPDRDGVSRETAWSDAGAEEHLWTKELGLGYSTFSVAGGRLYSMGYDKESGLDTVWCLDALTGEEVWTHSYPSKIWDRAHEGGTVNTPTIDGDVVYSLNREGNLYCLDGATGEVRWHTVLKPEDNPHELEYPTWGFSGSPLVVGDELLLNCGRLLRIDKKTGQVTWRSEDFGHGYGTPTAFTLRDEPVLAAMNGNGLAVVSRADGSTRYFHPYAGKQRGIHAATPVVVGDALFVCAGTIPSCGLFALGEEEVEPVWENRDMVSSFSGSVRMGDHLYGFGGQVLKCVDLEGEVVWNERGIGNGAVSGAGERVLVMGGDGALRVIEATPAGFEVLSQAPLFEEGRFWTKPVLVNGIIYCRSSKGRVIARDHRLEQER